jgi:general secretion pathway protein D
VEHEIRLKDGEVSLLGGILQQQDTQSLTGIPGFSQIPILKYLFSQKNSETTDTEIVFAVIPHIIRQKNIEELNRRMIDVGTGNSIHLRPAATAPGHSDSPPVPQTPPAQSPSESPAALELNPPAGSAVKGGTFTVDVLVSKAEDVHSVALQIDYDPNALQVVNVSNGDFLSRGEQVVALIHREDPSKRTIEITASRPAKSDGVSGHGVITTLTFQAKACGRFPIRISQGAVTQSHERQIAVSGDEATVRVQ